MSPLPSENDLIFLSHRAAPPAPRCRRGATSQATKGLALEGSSRPLPLPAAADSLCIPPVFIGTDQLQVSPSPVAWVSSLLPPYGDPGSPRERQPASCRLGKAVTESCFRHKWLFRTSRDATQCFCKGKRNGLACRITSFATSYVHTYVCVRKNPRARSAAVERGCPGGSCPPLSERWVAF